MLDYAHHQHRSDKRHLLLLVLMLIVAAGVSLCAGDRWIGPESWWGPDGQLFVWQIRLPRTVAVVLVGAALALSGCVMQGLFRNPLADPGLLGVSSGAALAVACWLVLPLSVPALVALYAPMLAAFIGSMAVMVVIFILSRAGDTSLSRLLLEGQFPPKSVIAVGVDPVTAPGVFKFTQTAA